LGPEKLYRLLQQTWLELVQEVVQAYEGTLASGTGEGLTVLFGAPIAQEDHARRAGVSGYGARVMSRFVGRTQELTILQAGLPQAARGLGQGIGIVGDPGMGKSRLLAEFRRRLAGQAVTYNEGHCLPYGQAMPYLPLREAENFILTPLHRPRIYGTDRVSVR
jgi:hypothetical protein